MVKYCVTAFLELFLVLLLGACANDAEQSTSTTTTQSLSGVISVTAGTAVDSDVNDINATYLSNDSLESAQAIPSSVSLGGYANVAGSGVAGRSHTSGDADDYFSSYLLASQTITLFVSNVSNTAQALDLYLLDAQGNILQSSLAISTTATITTTVDGKQFIHVHAATGASSYVLTLSSPANPANATLSNDLDITQDFVPGEVIVEFQEMTSIAAANISHSQSAVVVGLQAKAGAPGRSMLFSLGDVTTRLQAYKTLGISAASTAQMDSETALKQDTINVVKALRKRADIKSARLNYIRQATAVPNDTYYALQWHYPLINLPNAWDITTGSADVTVAVIDTGVLLNHPDLQGQLVAGYDFISSASNAADGDGIDSDPNDVGDGNGGASSFHGTHVSGTIAAKTNNGIGVAGVAWNVKIMPLRVLGRSGGTDYDIEQAVRFAAGLANNSGTVPAKPADIINLSLGGVTTSTQAPPAFQAARQAGVIVVAAAGNNGRNEMSYPASLDGVVSVSAVGPDSLRAPYSNYNTTVDVAGPGGDSGVDLDNNGYGDGVLSTLGDDSSGTVDFIYAFYQGTSMAAPHVAGVAALMRSVYPQLTPAEFDQLLAAGSLSNDLGTVGKDDKYGYGLIDAYQAVVTASALASSNAPPPDIQISASPSILNFSYDQTALSLQISQQGTGTTTLLSVNSDSSQWLTITATQVDANGFGTYTATVDRSVLTPDTYTATIGIVTSLSTQSLTVAMQVLSTQSVNHAGMQYVSLLDNESGNVVQTQRVVLTNGAYQYQFDNVPAGTYAIYANSNNYGGGQICAAAEACGQYIELVNVGASSLSGLDFSIGFDGN